MASIPSGIGGWRLWPNGMALVAECWPGASRPVVSGAMMAGMNAGILLLSQAVRFWPLSPDSWRWVFQLAALPALLGVVVLAALPESPQWLAARVHRESSGPVPSARIRELFRPGLVRLTLIGMLVSAIPMVGAWSASKWMIPWADSVAGPELAGYKATTQGWWALGATLGSFCGAQLASWLGRRRSYCLISLLTFTITTTMFLGTAPLEPLFHPVVLAQGFLATLYFGWLALALPELFPTQVRASGSGLCYNSGRFATAAGVLLAGLIFAALGGDYARVGAICASIYALGIFVIWLAPETGRRSL